MQWFWVALFCAALAASVETGPVMPRKQLRPDLYPHEG